MDVFKVQIILFGLVLIQVVSSYVTYSEEALIFSNNGQFSHIPNMIQSHHESGYVDLIVPTETSNYQDNTFSTNKSYKDVDANLIVTAVTSNYHDDTVVTNQSNIRSYNDKVEKFSLKLVYDMVKSVHKGENLIVAPVTVWTLLSVIAEGAAGNTKSEILNALKLPNNSYVTRDGVRNLIDTLQVNTNTSTLAKLNAVFVNKNKTLVLQDFRTIAKDYYDTDIVALDLSDNNFATKINQDVSQLTHGKISKLVDNTLFGDSGAILTSVLYFEGSWSGPFSKKLTSKKPFFMDGFKNMIGDVNMMYRRDVFPLITVNELEARVLELEYDRKNLSMLFLLPNSNTDLDHLISKLKDVSLEKILEDLRSSMKYGGDTVDLYVPRFKIESDVILTDILKQDFGIQDLFNESSANLSPMSPNHLFVNKIVQKAVIDITEEGTKAAGATTAQFETKLFTVYIFEMNRPFAYFIVEKTTNSILFGGIYKTPSLY